MAQFDQQQSNQRTQSVIGATSTRSGPGVPGKSTLVQQLPPAGASGAPAAPSTATATAVTAASTATPTGPSRVVAGGGGYIYQQFADGTIKVLQGPTSAGKVLPPGDPMNEAITAQIGPFVPAAPAAPSATPTAPDDATAAPGGAVDSVVGAVTGAVSGAVDAVIGAVTGTVGAVAGGIETFFGIGGAASQAPAVDAPTAGAPATPAAPAKPAVVPVDPANHQSRATFVGPMVGENSKTTQILDTIWPYFHKDDQVIAGFMTDVQLTWKVNFHWDEILWTCDKVSAMDVSEDCKTQLAALASGLAAFAPDPGKGAYLPNPPGTPVDKSTPAAFDARYNAVKDAKPKLQAILDAAGILAKYPKTSEPGRSFHNACDFVKPPSTSKHGQGYALDIKGDEDRIIAASAKVGMTGKAKEAYTHVEFADGGHAPGAAPTGDAKPS
jgi:hypothetical protein